MVVRAFRADVDPRGQGRPRARVLAGHAMLYKDKADTEYEKKIRDSYLATYGGIKPLEGALEVEITCFFDVPKSVTKKEREEIMQGCVPYIKKPDLDNLCKSTLDAINGVAFLDDRQVIRMKTGKYYANGVVDKGVAVIIREVEA